MLPFFNMRYRNSNMAILQPHIEKMKRGELTLESVLEEDEIIQDLKTNPNSQFVYMLSTEAIRKLIDYSTKMPKSDDKNVGYKYPFNATEILCCDNNAVMERIMHELKMGGDDSDDEEDEKEEKEEKEEGEKEKKEEENEEFFEVKEDENKPETTQEQEQPEKKEEEKPQEEPKKEEETKEEPKTEEPKKEETPKEEIKQEEPKKEEETKPEEPKKEEAIPVEPKKEGEAQNTEIPQEKETQASEGAPKEEEKPKEEPQKGEEPKKEEPPKEESPKEEPKKEEPPKEEEPKKEEPPKEETPKKEPKKEEETQEEKSTKPENAEEQKQEGEQPQKNEEEEEPKQEENENQKNDEENEKEEEQEKEDEEQQQKEITIIYDNVDYLFGFLKESEETKSNYVLVGYFYKIVNHLFNTQQSKIVKYLFEYPKKNEFDVLGLMIKNMRRKSMGEIINKLLLFQEEGEEDFLPKKIELLEKVLEELKETKEEDKYQCICSTLETTFYNKGFFIEFMKEPKLLEIIYSILENCQDDSKKLISVLRLLINVHENILKNEEDRCTTSLAPENPMDFLSMFTGTYNLEETNQKDSDPELQKIVEDLIIKLIQYIEKSNLNFMNDLDDYSSEENKEFMSTYQVPQKKLGMKKLAQVEFFRTIIDLLINAYAKFDIDEIRNSIINVINIAQGKKLFWKLHKIFFDFPFCNLYQTLYLQIMEIILNDNAPNELIEYTFKEKEGENEKNLVEILINKAVNEMQFKFTSGRISFHPNYSFEVSILNKVLLSSNQYVKDLVNDNKNLAAFDKILGQEIDEIFNQKLLLNPDKDISMGPTNIAFDKEEPALKYFGKKNFMELLEEDNSIYSVYLKGEDYDTLLSEKKERELIEQEERKKIEEKNYNEGPEEEMTNGLGDSINIVDDNNNNVEQEETQNVEEEVKEKGDTGNEEEASSETEEEKSFNDPNYWKPEIIPNDDIMSAILNDLD